MRCGDGSATKNLNRQQFPFSFFTPPSPPPTEGILGHFSKRPFSREYVSVPQKLLELGMCCIHGDKHHNERDTARIDLYSTKPAGFPFLFLVEERCYSSPVSSGALWKIPTILPKPQSPSAPCCSGWKTVGATRAALF